MRPALLALLLIVAPARAQVIEIGDDGAAVTYARPAVFTAELPALSPQGRGTAAKRQGEGRATRCQIVRDPSPWLPLVACPSPLSGEGEGITEAAIIHGIDPALLRALAWQETHNRTDAVSPKGALGQMQLMPATAAMLGVDPFDPAQNIAGGATYLRQQLDRFQSVPLALAAYNAGPGAVVRFGGVPPFAETRAYVAAILARWRPGAATAAPRPPVNLLLIEVPTL